jgi:hypothetical protein
MAGRTMLDAIGNIGDFLGGLGVVVTLIYLAIQVRQNTKSTKTQSYQAAVSAASDWSRQVGIDSESCKIILAGSIDQGALSDIERVQYNLIMVSVLRNCENIHYQYINGAIDESTWIGWANRTHSFLAPEGAQAWWQNQESAFSPEFRLFANERHGTDGLPYSIVPNKPAA